MRALYTFIYCQSLQTLVVRNFFSEAIATQKLPAKAPAWGFHEPQSGMTWTLISYQNGTRLLSIFNADQELILAEKLSPDVQMTIHEILRDGVSSIQLSEQDVRVQVCDHSGRLLRHSQTPYFEQNLQAA